MNFTKWIQFILSIRLELLIFLSSIIFILFSVLDKIPSSSNSWDLVLNNSPNIIFLTCGILFFISSIILHFLKVNGNFTTKTKDFPYIELMFVGDKNLSDKQIDLIERVFSRFDRGHHKIIKTLYRYLDVTEIPLNDLYEMIKREDPGVIVSHNELYYRLKDLMNYGFLNLESIGPNSSKIHIKHNISEALYNRNLIRT